MIEELPYSLIPDVFIGLWRAKKCEFAFTEEDFERWCKFLPLGTRAFICMDDESKKVLGGFIVYPLLLPPCLFVQLIISLNAKAGRELEKKIESLVMSTGYDYVAGVIENPHGKAMARLYRRHNMQSIAQFFVLEVKR